jgi:hypothetical protein
MTHKTRRKRRSVLETFRTYISVYADIYSSTVVPLWSVRL